MLKEAAVNKKEPQENSDYKGPYEISSKNFMNSSH